MNTANKLLILQGLTESLKDYLPAVEYNEQSTNLESLYWHTLSKSKPWTQALPDERLIAKALGIGSNAVLDFEPINF